MTTIDPTEVCRKKNWDWYHHPLGMWFVGPGTESGVVEVWGQGKSLEEAVQKALANK